MMTIMTIAKTMVEIALRFSFIIMMLVTVLLYKSDILTKTC